MHSAGVQSVTLGHCSCGRKKLDFQVKPLPGLSLAAWREELCDDSDKNFILAGVEHGFDIVDSAEKSPLSAVTIIPQLNQVAPSMKLLPSRLSGKSYVVTI